MRLFVAVPVPDELKEKIAALGEEIKADGISLVKPKNMHLTIKFIGEVQPQKLPDIKEKLGKMRFGKFGCRLRGVGVFPNESYIRVVWAGCESGGKMEELAKDVMGTLRGFGGDERFSAHLTIARVKRKTDLREFLQKHMNDEFGNFTIERFELIESVLGGGEGPKYTVLAKFEAEE
jgi:2'-5' RNA ligase